MKERYNQHKEVRIEQSKTYYEKNKEKVLNYHKLYDETNKERIKEYQKIQIECECGCVIRKVEYPRHSKTKKHLSCLIKNK